MLLDQYKNPSNPIGKKTFKQKTEPRVDNILKVNIILVSVQTLKLLWVSWLNFLSLDRLIKGHFFLSFFLFLFLAHFDQLAEEIFYQCDGRVDAIVVGVGTGGTIAGISRKIKMLDPKIQIVGADPYGSILAIPASLNTDAPPNKV